MHIPGSNSGRIALSAYVGLFIMLATSVGVNVLLARRIRQFQPPKVGSLPHEEIKIGTAVPAITGKRLDGQSETIAYTGERFTVLYVFRPNCIWCARNANNFKTLLAAKGLEDRFIGLSLSDEGLAEYVKTNNLTIPILTSLSAETKKAYLLGGTPQTLVVSPQGRILKNWPGAWKDKSQSEVETFFHVKLPGLQWDASVPAPPVIRSSINNRSATKQYQ